MAIILPSGFNITNNEPVDARITLADQTARYALSSANVYEGLIVFQQDNNTLFVLTDTTNVGNSNGWTQLQIGSVSSNLPNGVISGSSQLSGTTITDLTIVNLTTVNETASVIFSSGSNRFGDFGNDTHEFTGSVQITGSLTTIGASTATSFNGAINSTNGVVSGSSQLTSSYDSRYLVTGSVTSSITQLNSFTSSLNIWTSSVATTGSNSFNGNQTITGSLLVSQNITGSASASFVSLAVNTTTPTQKIHLKGAVGIENGTTGGNTADQFVFGYAGSNLTQYTHKIQTGHDAQAALNRMDFLLANSSTTWKTPLQLRPDIVYVSGSLIVTGSINGTINATNGVISGSSQILGASGIVSGSSQITYASISSIPSGIVSGAAQIPALLPSGVVSGSSQIITANSITLGTHTAGNYVEVISGSTNQITVAGSGLESAVVTLSLPQNIHTSADIQFNSLGIGTAASTTAGEIRATGDITAFYSSDIRLKENIVPIPNALEKVNQISGNTYDWKEGYEEIHSHKGNDVGVIAQEIEEILPQIVRNRDNGFKAVQYEKIVPLLIEAIKELSAKIKVLENK